MSPPNSRVTCWVCQRAPLHHEKIWNDQIKRNNEWCDSSLNQSFFFPAIVDFLFFLSFSGAIEILSQSCFAVICSDVCNFVPNILHFFFVSCSIYHCLWKHTFSSLSSSSVKNQVHCKKAGERNTEHDLDTIKDVSDLYCLCAFASLTCCMSVSTIL